MVKNLPTMQETWVWSLGQEESYGIGDGNPLQYSCLESPVDRGVHGFTKSWIWLSDWAGSIQKEETYEISYGASSNKHITDVYVLIKKMSMIHRRVKNVKW